MLAGFNKVRGTAVHVGRQLIHDYVYMARRTDVDNGPGVQLDSCSHEQKKTPSSRKINLAW